MIGLTKEHLLKFTPETNKLRLNACVRIKDIKEANATIVNGRYKLDISVVTEATKSKIYLGGAEAEI